MIEITLIVLLLDVAAGLTALALRTKHRPATLILVSTMALVNVALLAMWVIL
jgi:hypothetical protein